MSELYLSKLMKRYWTCDHGATAVEYALIAVAMFTALVPGFYYVANAMGVKFQDVTNYFGFG